MSGLRCSRSRSRALPTCQVRLREARVVQGEGEVGAGGGGEPFGDDLPGLEPVGEGDHRVVVAERRPGAGGGGVGGGDPGQHTDRHVPVRAFGGGLQDGGGHGEDPRVAAGDDGDAAAPAGQVEGELGTFGLDLVVRAVPDLARAVRHPVEVGGVADEVLGGGERAPRLGGEPERAGRAGADHDDLAGRYRGGLLLGGHGRLPGGGGVDGEGGDPAGDHRDGEVRHRLRVGVGEVPGALALHGGALHVTGLGQPSARLRGRRVRPGRCGRASSPRPSRWRRGVRSARPRAGCRGGWSAPPRPRPGARRAGRRRR